MCVNVTGGHALLLFFVACAPLIHTVEEKDEMEEFIKCAFEKCHKTPLFAPSISMHLDI